MDVLADVLATTRLGGTVTARVKAQAPWGIALPTTPFAAFHAITQGVCWLRAPGQPSVQLVQGDVVLLPTGAGHILASGPDAPARPQADLLAAHPLTDDGELILPGPGPTTTIICARYAYQHDGAHPALALLPPLLHVPAAQATADAALQHTLRMLAAELPGHQPGARTIVDRLIDVLFVHLVRAWIASDTDRTCWLSALRDPPVAHALSRMHDDPAHPWTVAALADATGLSRAAFARRFTDLVGEPPLTYLTRWRMDLAARRLRNLDQPVAAVARSVGYNSEYAFSRAFHRARGLPPARYRATTRHTT